ncbi:MAG: glycosyltransferase [Syntrophales bacterium]|nr:glycosyltransferase [Syntrophales bacterium]
MKTIRRILYYTHNSVGIGHVFRARAIITGIRHWRPDIDFLVLSGTSVPHVLLREGIEVIKLPGVEKVMGMAAADPSPEQTSGGDDPLYKPRHLRSMTMDGVMTLRRKIISESFHFFQPDAVMVEHYLGGLLDEMIPVLADNRSRGNSPKIIKAALSRGIMGRNDGIFTACGRHRAETILNHYDLLYCFDDDTITDKDSLPADGQNSAASRIAYLGKITDKCREELPDRNLIYTRLRLPEKPIILLSLSRHGDIVGLCLRFLETFKRIGLDRDYQVIFVIDPYLDKGVIGNLQSNPLTAQVRFLPFFYPLVDLIHIADLVICRAGYNTVNELLLTGAKAIVIPEAHPSGEQEVRAASIPRANVAVMTEGEILHGPPDAAVRDLLARKGTPLSFDFNKYAIGKRIISDLEACSSSLRIL